MIGQRFGNYRAISLLGEGGMGAVYLAEHPQIGRRVAIKVLRPEMIREPQLLVRFLNEARAANAIRHPNIIEVLDSGTTPEGVPYLVMELLEGEVLSARIRRVTKLPLREAMEFAYQTASALAAAHDKGIIHRDLKPDNLFVVPYPSDPGREMMKVLDFGIAKLQTLPTGGGMQTRTGMLMGTPVYMSPEQCLGTRAVDNRSDIYALGIIMFEMLAGRPPFVSDGFGELVNMHLNVRPPSLRDLNAEVTTGIEGLIMKALEKSPDARQRSATELMMDIRAAGGQAVALRGISSPDLLSETMRGNTAGARAAASTMPMPVNKAGTGSTTMSGSTGERDAPTVKVKSNRGLIAAGAVVVVLLGVGGWVVTKKVGPPSPVGTTTKGSVEKPADSTTGAGTAQPDSKVPTTVQLNIDSDPSGASVMDVAAGTSLGSTPLMMVRPGSDKTLMVRVEKAGFVASTLVLNLARDTREMVSLAAAVAPAETQPQPTAHPAEHVKPAEHMKKDRPHHPAAHEEEEPAKL